MSPGSLLGMQSLGPHPDLQNRDLHFSKFPGASSVRGAGEAVVGVLMPQEGPDPDLRWHESEHLLFL